MAPAAVDHPLAHAVLADGGDGADAGEGIADIDHLQVVRALLRDPGHARLGRAQNPVTAVAVSGASCVCAMVRGVVACAAVRFRRFAVGGGFS